MPDDLFPNLPLTAGGGTAVMYESDLAETADPGYTPFYDDDDWPMPAGNTVTFHNTDDTSPGIDRWPTDVTKMTEINQDIGGESGKVDRNAYILGGFDMPDNHDFRGDHPIIERRDAGGSYGDAGDNDDAATSYGQTFAAHDWDGPTPVEQWDAMSGGY